ncbi:MAG TPA: preprotein translocase subunit YajC [bacterium]
MYHISLFLMQTEGQGSGSMFGLFLPMILIFVIMYFLIFRPQAKRQKQHQAMLQDLKKGDKIVTSGGIFGTIVGLKETEQTVIVEIDDNVKVKVARASIARKVSKEDGGA